MDTTSILHEARDRRKAVDALETGLRAEIAAIETRIGELPRLSLSDGLRTIADAVAARMPGEGVELLGPHGIDCLMSIHVRRNGSTVASMTFRPDREDGYRVVDYARDTGEYPRNSVAARSGANHPDEPMPPTVDAIVSVLRSEMMRRAA